MVQNAREIGLKITKIREEKNISREQMAEHMGICVNTLGTIERGVRYPTVEETAKIAELGGVTEQDILFGDPRTVYDHCNYSGFYNHGPVNVNSLEDVSKHFDDLIAVHKEQTQNMTEQFQLVLHQKDGMIEQLLQVIKGLNEE